MARFVSWTGCLPTWIGNPPGWLPVQFSSVRPGCQSVRLPSGVPRNECLVTWPGRCLLRRFGHMPWSRAHSQVGDWRESCVSGVKFACPQILDITNVRIFVWQTNGKQSKHFAPLDHWPIKDKQSALSCAQRTLDANPCRSPSNYVN